MGPDDASTGVTTHAMVRYDIPTGQVFAEFVAAFERAVPELDLPRLQGLAAEGGSWEDMEAAVAEDAPHGFMVFAELDAGPLLALAGHRHAAVEYLMGNHVIAERMYRHHPDTLLYAPLRVLVREADDGTAVFTLDQPSSTFGGLGIAAVTDVGRELDRKVAALLHHLAVPVPPGFTA